MGGVSRCADCAWWEEVPGPGRWGRCRLRAPAVSADGKTWFPRTSGERDWCAEGVSLGGGRPVER